MTSTDKVLNIYQRLNAIMAEVTGIQKEDKKVNNQYTFVSHDAVAGALHHPMVKHGVMMIPSVAKLNQDGNRTEVMMDIAFVNCDDSNDKVIVSYPGYGIDPSDKGIGKAISYAVKYALLKVFCLETGDDIEKHNMEYKPPVKDIKPATEMSVEDFVSMYPLEEREVVIACIKNLAKVSNKEEVVIVNRAAANQDGFKQTLQAYKNGLQK